jgi:hypothetical protein
MAEIVEEFKSTSIFSIPRISKRLCHPSRSAIRTKIFSSEITVPSFTPERIEYNSSPEREESQKMF